MALTKPSRWLQRMPIRLWVLLLTALYLIGFIWTTSKIEADTTATTVGSPSPIVLVLIMNSVVDPHKHEARKRSILDTWGVNRTVGRAAFVFRFVEIMHKEELEETRAFWMELQRAHKLFGERLSWVMKCDDITFVMVEHLQRYLLQLTASSEQSRPILAGNLLSAPKSIRFVSGGAGIVLNRAAREGLVKSRCLEEISVMAARGRLWWAGSMDIALTQCAIQTFGKSLRLVNAMDVVDTKARGAYFNVFDPVKLVRGQFDGWYTEYKQRAMGLAENSPYTEACCSQHPVTFHYVESQSCYFFHRLIHTRYTREDLRNWIATSWPRHVGGHASHPKGANEVSRLADLFLNISLAA